MSYLLLLLYLGLIGWFIKKASFFKSNSFGYPVIVSVFLLKFAGGLSLYLVYSHIYSDRLTGDIFKYFDDGTIIYSALYQNPVDYLRMITGIGADAPHLMQYYDTCHFWLKEFNYGLINDNHIVIRFNALVRLISLGNIHIHTLFMSFLSFVGFWGIFKVFEAHFKEKKWYLLGVVFFFPSVWFWTSGLLKEGLLMFSFGMMFYFVNLLVIQKFTWPLFIGIVIMLFILFLSKFYVLIASLPALFFIIAHRYFPFKRPFLQFVGIHLILFFILWFSKPFFGLDFPEIIAQKQNDFINFTQSLNHVGSQIELPKLEPSFIGMLQLTPQALFNSFFRPSVFEIHNSLTALAALENLLIVAGLLLLILFFNKKSVHEPLLWFSTSFVLILFTLIGLTTPILGALVRYKSPALPFLGIIFLYLINLKQIQTLFNLKKWNKLP